MERIGQHGTEGIDPGHPAGDGPEEFPQTVGANPDVGDHPGQVDGEGSSASFGSSLAAWVTEDPMSTNGFLLGNLLIASEEAMQIEATDYLAPRTREQLQTAVHSILELLLGLAVGGETIALALPN